MTISSKMNDVLRVRSELLTMDVIGTQTFPLNDDDADEWILYDPDYENPQE